MNGYPATLEQSGHIAIFFDELGLKWLQMIRRIWIAFYAVALVILALQFLALTLFCLTSIFATHDMPWPFLFGDLFVALFFWYIWGSMRRKIRNAREHDVSASLLMTPIGGWLMVALGAPALVGALVFLIRTELFLHRSIVTDGTVIRLLADQDETVHYAPVFAFTTEGGRAVEIQSTSYSAPPEFGVGQKVRVLYEKDRPEQARIATHWQVHGAEDILGAMGLGFAGIGIGSLIYQRRRNRRVAGLTLAS